MDPFANFGRVTEVCGSSCSGKTQLLLTTAAGAALEDPTLTVGVVCCTAAQSIISRLRSLVVALVTRRVNSAVASGTDLEIVLPRTAALLRAEEIEGTVAAALHASLAQSMEDEAAECLKQIHVASVVEAGALVLFLRCLASALDGGDKGEGTGGTSLGTVEAKLEISAAYQVATAAASLPTQLDREGATTVSAVPPPPPLVDLEAIATEADFSAAFGHARSAANAIAAQVQCRSAGIGPLMLVVDGLGSTLGAALSGNAGHQAGFALVVAVGAALLALARCHDVAVLVSNTVVADRVTRSRGGGGSADVPALGLKPANGVSWAAVPDSRFLLRPLPSAMDAMKQILSDGRVEVTALKMRDAVSGLPLDVISCVHFAACMPRFSRAI